MKKNIGMKLLFSLATLVLFSTNVNATITGKSYSQELGYTFYQQEFNGNTAFCLSPNKAIKTDLSKCTVSNAQVTGLSNANTIENQYIARVAFGSSSVPGSGTAKGKELAAQANNVSIKVTEKVKMSATLNGSTVVVTISGPNVNLVKSVKDENGTTLSGSGSTWTMTVDPSSCIDKTFTAYGDGSGSTPSTDSSWLYYSCPGAQSYLVYVTPGNPSPGTNTKENTLGSTTLNVCDTPCTGTAEAAQCAEQSNGYAKDTDKIKSCVINGKYKSSYCPEVSIQKEINNYCTVYCTEEVEFEFPGTIDTESNGYFKLKNDNTGKPITISGKQTCYTNRVDREQYHDDVVDIQTKQIELINEGRRLQAMIDAYNGGGQTHAVTITNYYNNGNKPNSNTKSNSCTYYRTNYEKEYTVYIPVVDADKYSVVKYVESTDTYNYSYVSQGGCGYNTETNQLASDIKNADPKALYAQAVAMNDQVESKRNQLWKCYDWTQNYCLNPTATFSYDEPYDENIDLKTVNGKLTNDSKQSDKLVYKDVNEQYEGSSVASYKNDHYLYLQATGEGNLNNSKDLIVIDDNINYVYVKSSYSKEYQFDDHSTTKVCTYSPYGTILGGEDCENKKNTTYIDDGYVYPVALQHDPDTGVGNYYVKIDNVGSAAHINDNSCGNDNRVIGCDTSLVTKVTQTDEYACNYTYKDCPGCKVECSCTKPNGEQIPGCIEEKVDDKKKICKFADCPTCKTYCVGCLWNDGDIAISYKQISLSNVFPNQNTDEVGYNWNTSSVNKEASKAEKTIEKIEKTGEKIYENEPEYRIVLDASTMGKIRQYNKISNSSQSSTKYDVWDDIPTGGYNNDTLTCKDGVKCQSSFLDGLYSMNSSNNNLRTNRWRIFNEETQSWSYEK